MELWKQADVLSCSDIHCLCNNIECSLKKMHACSSSICNSAINYPQHKTDLCFLHLCPTVSWCFGGIFLTDKKALCSVVTCPLAFAQIPICHSQMSSPICSTLVWPQYQVAWLWVIISNMQLELLCWFLFANVCNANCLFCFFKCTLTILSLS